MRVFGLFLAWILAEIAAFVVVGGWIGVWGVLVVVIGSAIGGGLLIRGRGMATLRAMPRERMTILQSIEQLAHGGMIALAGILLIMPGLIGDALGLLLLIPPVRVGLIHLLERFVRNKTSPGQRATWRSEAGGGDVFDGDYSEIRPEQDQIRPPSGWTRH